MKKGLRREVQWDLSDRCGNEHRPDEKGIATDGRHAVFGVIANEHRPDEKGIATGNYYLLHTTS